MKGFLQRSISLVPWRFRAAIKKLPLIAPVQRRLLARFLEGREFVHTVDAGPARGLKYPVTLPQDKGIWTGTYESGLATRVAASVPPAGICLDIGGWHGFFSGVMALAGASKVIVFEPLPANVRQIRKMLELNAHLPIELMDVALGNRIGTAKLRALSETSMAKFVHSSFQPDHQVGDTVDVRVETLDGFRAKGLFARADVIKIDVEGAEAMVLEGAAKLLHDQHPRLFIEIHSRELARECAALLLGFNYAIEVIETRRPPNFSSEPEVSHFDASFS